MVQAGYPDGRDAKTGKPLVLNYDYGKPASPERKAEMDWMVRQFAKLGVQLEIRTTDYNQFRDKMRRGAQQVYWWGWTPDYPDAENYLFLLTGAQSMARTTAATRSTTRTTTTTACTPSCARWTTGRASRIWSTAWWPSRSTTRPGRWATSPTRRWPSSPGCTTASPAS
jgi:ABC-type transport system substrate-binding protein